MTTKIINKIGEDVKELKEGLLEKRPERFSFRDVIRAFFGALVIGVLFVFKGGLLEIVEKIDWTHTAVIIIATLLLLAAEIYFIGYIRVREEKGRNAFEFIMKRLPTVYIVSFLVSLFLTYLFGVNLLFSGHVLKLVFVITFPCSIGAAVADLLKQY